MDQALLPDLFHRTTPSMGRRLVAEVQAVGQCLGSTPMTRGLRPCILSRQPLLPAIREEPTATEHFRPAVCYCPQTPFMGRPVGAVLWVLARCLPSIPMAPVLLSCI